MSLKLYSRKQREEMAALGKTAEEKTAPIITHRLGGLVKFETSIERLEEMTNRSFLIDGLIQEKSHTVIYGASGTGKTTLMFYFVKEAKEKKPDLDIFYFLLDGADQIALNGARYYDDPNTLHILNLVQARDIMEELYKNIKEKIDLSNVLFIFDTYKKFQSDVNNKGANSKHMHILRELTSLGATVVSVAHTNKDGKNFSGTAEMEQDADAVIKVNKMIDVEDEESMTVSLSEGGRIRWRLIPRSYKIPRNNPNPRLIAPIDYVDMKDAEFLDEYAEIIAVVRLSLTEDGDGNQKALYERLEEDVFCGRDKFFELLHKGRGRFWKATRTTKKSYIYSSLD